MKLWMCSIVVAACLLGLAAPSAAQCEPDGEVQFVCGPISPEDLALVPDTPWVIVASWEDDGYLSAADSRDYATVRLFPTATSRARHDRATYGSCPGMDDRPVPRAWHQSAPGRRRHPHAVCRPPRRTGSGRGIRGERAKRDAEPDLGRMRRCAGRPRPERRRRIARRWVCGHEPAHEQHLGVAHRRRMDPCAR